MDKSGIIYKATNLINGKIYIGQTTRSLEVRIKRHIGDSKIPNNKNYFHKALAKYRPDNWKWEIIDEADSVEKLNEKEEYWIAVYDSFNNPSKGYNTKSGGLNNKHTEKTKKLISESGKGRIWSEESRNKLSNSLKGRKMSEEEKEKRRGSNNGFYGKKHTPEAKLKQGWFKGGHHTEEARLKMSMKLRGQKRTEETRRKISEARKGKSTGPFSQEHLQKMREANLGAKNPRARNIVCVETGVVYGCITDAERALGISRKQISRNCLGQAKSAGGMHFKYLDDK